MDIKYSSSVLITQKFEEIKHFYIEVLKQEIKFDFGNCIGFKNGISIWELKPGYPIAEKLQRTYSEKGNENLELCFETDDFDCFLEHMGKFDVKFLHGVVEESWGQKTIRFYDPENNLVEMGESISCFVKRYLRKGMSAEEVSARTSVPIDFVRDIDKGSVCN